MSEHVSFALVLLVAVASVASLLFLSGTSATGNVVGPDAFAVKKYFPQPFAPAGSAIALPPYVPCAEVSCPAHQPAYALQEPDGALALGLGGKPICICLPPQQE